MLALNRLTLGDVECCRAVGSATVTTVLTVALFVPKKKCEGDSSPGTYIATDSEIYCPPLKYNVPHGSKYFNRNISSPQVKYYAPLYNTVYYNGYTRNNIFLAVIKNIILI